MTTLVILGMGCIFLILVGLAALERRDRRRDMGLPEIVLNEDHPRANGNRLRLRDEDWRTDAPSWSDPRYYGRLSSWPTRAAYERDLERAKRRQP